MKIVVVGAGLAGLSAAMMLTEAGHRVEIVSKGIGGLLLSTGGLDVAGWNADGTPVSQPFEAVESYAGSEHPYAKIGAESVRKGIGWLSSRTPAFHFPAGDETNALIPTPLGLCGQCSDSTPPWLAWKTGKRSPLWESSSSKISQPSSLQTT